jgi:hypothetical protein
MTEQSMQETVDKPVQHRKKRSRSDKIGRLKYNQFLLKRVLAKIEKVEEMQRIILNGLKGAGYFHFELPMIQRLTCSDQVDLEILERVYQAGLEGVFPKDVAAGLSQYGLQYYDVSRRIVRMNRRLAHETGEVLFEKRGWKWALTKFAFDVWNASSKEINREKEEVSE